MASVQVPAPAKIWARKPSELIDNFRYCIGLLDTYKREFHATKEKLQQIPKGRQFNFDETVIFNKFTVFSKRLDKLIDMFTSVFQQQALVSEEVDGMEDLVKDYGALLAEFQKKNHDILDHDLTIFERDFVEFMMRNSEIEANIMVRGVSTAAEHDVLAYLLPFPPCLNHSLFSRNSSTRRLRTSPTSCRP